MNPFRPGFVRPVVAARRDQLWRQWSEALHPAGHGHPAVKTVLQGDRGIGKTVLLDVAHDIALEYGWRVVDASGLHAQPLSSRLIDRLWRPDTGRPASTTFGARLGPVTAHRVWAPPTEVAPRSLREAVELVLSGDQPPTGVLVEVDELHDVPTEQLKEVAGDLQLLERDGYNVGIVGAGLPSLDLDDRKVSPTFLGRAWRPELGAVDDDELARVFVQTLAEATGECSPHGLQRVVAAIGGLPYALQLLGWHLVDRFGEGRTVIPNDVDAVLPEVHVGLVRALRVPYRVSPGRREFLAAMADHSGPAELLTICQRLGRTQQQVSPTRAWLLKNGYLAAPEYGKLEFSHIGLRAIISTDPAVASRVAELSPKISALPPTRRREVEAPRPQSGADDDL